MDSNYDSLPLEIKTVLKNAIDMRINGKPYRRDVGIGDDVDIDYCVLFLAIIENDDDIKAFVNKLDPELLDRLKSKIDWINGTKSKIFSPKSSRDYEKDYYNFKFNYVIYNILERLKNYEKRFKQKYDDEILKISSLSSSLIVWILMNDRNIINIFTELEDNPEVKGFVTEDENSYYSKFKTFLNSKMQEEKSISFVERTTTDNFIKIPEVLSTQEIRNRESAKLDIFIQSAEGKTATLNSQEASFSYQTANVEERAEDVMSNPENIKKMLTSIQQKFIGQEEAAKLLLLNIIKNQKLASLPNVPSGTRSIMFIDGPSGTGKTAITKDITDNLGLPFVATSITNYSAAGYVGGNITDILKELYIKAGGDLEKAERGIVVLDELDKIVNSGRNDLVMKSAVQHQLLDFLGGGKYTIEVDKGKTVDFDTSKLTFVCLGALTNLRNSKMQVSSKRPIGFNVKYDEKKDAKDYSITPDDLIKMGFEKELVGRFNTYVHTKDYSKDDLKKILLESKISPLIGFKTFVSSLGKKLVIDDDAYDLIAEAAHDLNTGARSLQAVVNNLETQYLEESLLGVDNEIHVTEEDVRRINEAAFKEKGRR